jgi:predicted RNA polymerase sigma factor
VAAAHRREWARVLTATVRVTRDLDAAEEAVQDAYVQALRTWARDGVPDRPGAWLATVAQRATGSPSRAATRSPTTGCGWSSPSPMLSRPATPCPSASTRC